MSIDLLGKIISVACQVPVNPLNAGASAEGKIKGLALGTDDTKVVIGSALDLAANFFRECALYKNYANPFNPSTTIEFALPKSAFVTLKIYNLLGEEVATLIAEQRAAGIHQLNWDARGLASGVYLYRLEAGSFVSVKKLILIR